ncbi:MAG: hypothetical protein KDA22_08975, partial [Phycisphaerales bacterium]|nr:hypothetical protein [Phycisphaerales bacterium]
MSKVLEWVKSNLVIVILGVAIVAVLILAPILASGLNESVATEAKSRAAKMSQLDSLARTSMKLDVPGRETIEVTTVANPKLLAQYEKFATSLRDDAAAVRKLAIEHNRKGRGVLIPRLFPKMPPPERDTLPSEFYRTLITAYENLLHSVRAGGPPSASEVTETLLNRESQFIMNNFRKQQRSDLDAQEVKDLDNELSRARLAAYGEAASSMAMYATLANLDVPAYPPNRLPTMPEMFDWQWKFWIQDDVLRALGEANGDSTSVVMSPVKRVLSLAVLNGLPVGAGGGGPGGGGPSLGGSGAIGGRRGFGAAESGGGGAPEEEPELE